MSESVPERIRIAQKLVSVKQKVAQAMSDEFFLNHPEWAVRYGDRGRQFCTADACFHVDFLAGAVEAGSPEAFAGYSRWTARMLGARGIAAHTLEENLAQLEKHLSGALVPEDLDTISTFLARGREACKEPEPVADHEPADGRLSLTRQVFLASILGGQRQAAINIIEEALRAGHSQVDIYVDVFAESLHRVGKLWESNHITVAQEHTATAITQYALAVIYPHLAPATVHRGSMVVTGVSGELHQVGANLVADAMEANGWTVRFLGTNLPHSAVIAAVEESSADVLSISTTIVANLPAVQSWFEPSAASWANVLLRLSWEERLIFWPHNLRGRSARTAPSRICAKRSPRSVRSSYYVQVTNTFDKKSGAGLLAQARINHKRLPELPASIRPKTPGEAYAVQDSLIEQLLAHYGGGVIGYKVACTNVTAQRQLNVDAPFSGRLLSAFFFESPARVDASKFFMRVVEAEFGFEMAHDLPPTPQPRSRQEIAAAVKGVLPAIEIVDSRFDEWTTIGAPSLIADNACNAAWVKGHPYCRLAIR